MVKIAKLPSKKRKLYREMSISACFLITWQKVPCAIENKTRKIFPASERDSRHVAN